MPPWFLAELTAHARRPVTATDTLRRRRFATSLTNAMTSIRKLHAASVPIIACTDSPYPGVYFAEGLHRELELLVEAGLTPLESISAATRNAAAFMRDTTWGTVVPGRRADLLLTNGRPHERIGDTRRIVAVMQAGRLLPRKQLTSALRAQTRGIEAVRSLTPLSLATGYVGDLGAASVGDLIYRPPPVVVKPALRHPDREEAERYGACRLALALAPAGTIPPECAAIGVTDPAACIAQEQQSPSPDDARVPAATPVTQKRWRVPGVFLPLAAMVRTATRVASNGVFASILAVFQLAAGLLCVLVIVKARTKTHAVGHGGATYYLALLPIAAVVVGSGLAWVTQALMLGALQVFQWATGLAAAAAGASGLAGFCWYCVAKLSEKSVEGVVTGKR